MRFIALLLFATILLSDQHIIIEKKQKLTLGLGAYIQTQPYKGTDALLLSSPVVFFDNGLFYIRWSRAGIYFYGDNSSDIIWAFSLTIQPRTYGYKASDSSYLHNMQERENTFEGGIAFSIAKGDLYLETMALTDILHRSEAWLIKSEMGDKYEFGKLLIYPSLIISYQSDEFMDYYYGILETEEDLSIGRNAYRASAGFQIGAQTYVKYPFNDKFSTLINLRIDRLPSSAIDSPIIEKNYIFSGLASLIYTFEY